VTDDLPALLSDHSSRPLRVALIGFGAVGQGVARLLRAHACQHVELVAALVRDQSRPRSIDPPRLVSTVEVLLAERPDVVVEVAGHEALSCHGPQVLRAGMDLLLISIGALARTEVEDALRDAARAGGARAQLVSGAIGGLDAIASAAIGGLDSVVHTTRKPARALLPPDEAEALTEPRELFRGSAREGVLRFPESVNVAAAVSFAGLGLARTQLCVIADPRIERNQHEVVAEGTFGMLRFEIRGIPSEDNPRSGRIVAMSVVHALHRRLAWLQIG
jgi:aspartate dehydrogenase